MATLTFSYDTGLVPLSRIYTAFGDTFNYQSTVLQNKVQVPNPETIDLFTRRMVANYLIGIVKQDDIVQAVNTASAAVVPIVLT